MLSVFYILLRTVRYSKISVLSSVITGPFTVWGSWTAASKQEHTFTLHIMSNTIYWNLLDLISGPHKRLKVLDTLCDSVRYKKEEMTSL